jgi:hypothetical protein
LNAEAQTNRRPPVAHHHAPEPFRVLSALAEGVLEIVELPEGERMRLTATRSVAGLQAVVTIERPTGVETLVLVPIGDQRYQSAEAPREPHEFVGRLSLAADDRHHDLPFRMDEPEGHHH